MGHFKKLLAGLAVVVGLVLAPAAGFAAAGDSIYTITNNARIAIEEFITFTEDTSMTEEEYLDQFPSKARSLESKLDDAISDLDAYSATGSEGPAVDSLATHLTSMRSALQNARTAVDTGDADAYVQSIDDFNAGLDAYNKSLDELNKVVTGFTESEQNLMYIALAVATGVISAGSFAWAFRHRVNDNDQLKAARRGVALSSLWPLGGALLTLGTYMFTTDGTYFVAWGPVLIGAVFYIKNIIDYVRLAKAQPASVAAPAGAQPATQPAIHTPETAPSNDSRGTPKPQ